MIPRDRRESPLVIVINHGKRNPASNIALNWRLITFSRLETVDLTIGMGSSSSYLESAIHFEPRTGRSRCRTLRRRRRRGHCRRQRLRAKKNLRADIELHLDTLHTLINDSHLKLEFCHQHETRAVLLETFFLNSLQNRQNSLKHSPLKIFFPILGKNWVLLHFY